MISTYSQLRAKGRAEGVSVLKLQTMRFCGGTNANPQSCA